MNVSPGTYWLLTLFLGQIMFFSLGTLTLQYYRLIEGTTVFFAAFFLVLNYLIAIIFFKRIFQADCAVLLLQRQEATLHKMESTIRLIRHQRHDIANHLHTIYALLQMGREHQAKKYVNEVELATTNVFHAARLEVPELAAFLQGKLGQAMAKNISLNIEALTSLKDCHIKPYFLVIILGNLLDNAFEAVEDLPVEERLVELEITEQENYYRFTVTNSGPSIEESLYGKIFEAGYSTKEPGRGYGLAIVRETVLNHRGNIEISNNPTTTFVVTLPKKEGDTGDPSACPKDS